MAKSAQKNILIVENNEESLFVYVSFLKKAPTCSLKVAKDGLEALEMAEKNDFDLIHVNINIPKLDGLETVKKLRAIPKYQKVPIIIVSAIRPDEGQKKSIAVGADDFISIPVSRAFYLEKVHYYLSKN